MEEEYKGFTIKIEHDDDPENPRDWDNIGTMVCFHDRYDLGDKHEFDEPDDFIAWLKEQGNKVFSLPLYLYDHSGITMKTSSFNDRWDSGAVGWIYVTVEKAKQELGNYEWKQLKGRTYSVLESEVKDYDMYISGEVYGFQITDEQGEELEDGSVWGIFGYTETLEEAKRTIDGYYKLPRSRRPRKAAPNAKEYHQ
jgi:hypothetical protein